MNRKGAVPIPYIIAMVFGVAIIAVVGYLLYTGQIDFIQAVTLKKCEALEAEFCSKYVMGEIGDDARFSEYASECSDKFDEQHELWATGTASGICGGE